MEEIDLGEYFQVILKHWKVVAGALLLATITAAVAAFAQSPIYEATVTIMEPSYRLEAGGGLTSMDEKVGEGIKVLPTVAKSATIEEQVIEALESVLSPAERARGALLKTVKVVADKNDPSLFQIKVRSSDPDKASQIADTWAEKCVEYMTGPTAKSSGELEFVKAELQAAEQELMAAEEELARFQAESGLGVASGGLDPYAALGERGKELEAKTLLLASHRVARDNLLRLLQAAQEMKEAGGTVTDLPLQLLSVEVIVNRGQLSPELIKEQGSDIDAVIAMIEREERIISGVIDTLSAEVAQLQEALERDGVELARLQRRAKDAEEDYNLLSDKVQEIEIRRSGVIILSPAIKPGQPMGSISKPLVIAVGVAAGVVVGVFGAFALEYFERSPVEKQGK